MMANLAATLTVLFFLFAFSYASTPSVVPANDVIGHDLSNSIPKFETKPTLLLPSEKHESDEKISVAELVTENTDIDAKTARTAADLPEFSTQTIETVPLERPLKIVRFRPINRHFPANRHGFFRIPLRPCHHGMKPMMKPRELSFGNDMIMAGESKEFDPAAIRGGVRQIPTQWIRIHHHHHHHEREGMPRFPLRNQHHDMFAKQKFRSVFRDEEDIEEREEKNGREEREDGGFMSSVRKFLNHHF